MGLTQEEVITILQAGKMPEVQQAVDHEKRLEMHTTPTDSVPNNEAFKDFLLDKPRKILTAEKSATFEALLTYPLQTIDLTDHAYTELKRVFDGQNRVLDFNFNAPELEQDFNSYRSRLGEPDFWDSTLWEFFKVKPHSYIVVDLPAQINVVDAPEPYFVIVETCDIYSTKNTITGDNIYFIYEQREIDEEGEELQVFIQVDDEFYRRFVLKDDEYIMEVENVHNIGHSPARRIYNMPKGTSKFFVKNPVSPVLGSLDWWLYENTTNRHLKQYAGFPITSLYEQECNYQTIEGYSCDRGYIQYPELHNDDGHLIQRAEVKGCPKCDAGKAFLGPGSFVTVPAPKSSEESNLIPAVDMVTGDTDAIKTFAESLDHSGQQILFKIIGFAGEPENNQAKNEKQVTSGFETRQNVLFEVKKRFEEIHGWTLSTIAMLRYGDGFIGANVNYGTKFYLQTITELNENYKQSKENGLPMYELESQREAIIRKKYKNDPESLERFMILDKLEPLRDMSIQNVMVLQAQLSPTKVKLKMNFNDLISDFEMEEGSIVTFMRDMDPVFKIAFIREWLEKRVAEIDDFEPPEKEARIEE